MASQFYTHLERTIKRTLTTTRAPSPVPLATSLRLFDRKGESNSVVFETTTRFLGIDSQRSTVLLDLQNLTVTCGEQANPIPVNDIVSLTEVDGGLDIVLRTSSEEKEGQLKEEKWFFPEGDSSLFVRTINSMCARGPTLRAIFDELDDKEKAGFISKDDIERSLRSLPAPIQGLFPPGVVGRMMTTTDPSRSLRVSFADLFAFLFDHDALDAQSVEEFLLSWARAASPELDAHTSVLVGRPSEANRGKVAASASASSASASASAASIRSSTATDKEILTFVHGGYADDPNLPQLVDGEVLVSRMEGVTFVQSVSCSSLYALVAAATSGGVLFMTNFRIVLVIPSRPSSTVTVPLGAISRVERLGDDKAGGQHGGFQGFHFALTLKDFRGVFFAIPRDDALVSFLYMLLQSHVFQPNPLDLFAFRATRASSSARVRSTSKGDEFYSWSIFDADKEFARQGLIPEPPMKGPRATASSTSSSRPSDAESMALAAAAELQAAAAARNRKLWRLWRDNFTLVDSYPEAFLVPAAMTDEEICEAARFRSRHRIPAITWCEPRNGAILARSSQPMSGITSKGNLSDKLLLNLLRVKGRPHDSSDAAQSRFLYVIDCRSQIAANANAAMGKGVENYRALINTRVIFCGIANIHTMRASFQALQRVLVPGGAQSKKTADAVSGLQVKFNNGIESLKRGLRVLSMSALSPIAAGASPSQGQGQGESGVASAKLASAASSSSSSPASPAPPLPPPPPALPVEGASEADDGSLDDRYLDFGLRVEETGWLHHIRRVLAASALVADKLLNDESSVLIHCSDGWDRTSQVCSTAQLILDPFYRTIEGFATLIEKDWMAFGHKFHDRLGHGVALDESKEVSPVFLQFLDVCSQLLLQFPSAFEFSENLLVFLADALYSNLFGDFIGNCERERREELEVDQNTKSVWRYVTSPQHRGRFLNQEYTHSTEAIFPNVRRVRLWERYYCRFDPTMKPTSGEEWVEDWGDLVERSNSTTSTCYSVKTA